MPVSLVLLSVPMLAASLMGVTLGLLLWRRGGVNGARMLALSMFASAWWSLGSLLMMHAGDVTLRLLWAKFEQIGIAPLAVFYFLFAMQFGRITVGPTRLVTALLMVLPLLTVIFTFGYPSITLYWTGISLHPRSGVLIFESGPWLYAHSVYSYLLLVLGAMAILRSLSRISHHYWRQVIAFIISALLPVLFDMLSVADIINFEGVNPAPMTFVISGVLLWWGVLRMNLLDISVIARDVLLDTMDDPVVVIDTNRRIIDMNAAFRRLLPAGGPEPVGASTADGSVLPGVDLVKHLSDGSDEVRIGADASGHVYHVRSTPLATGDRNGTGSVIVLRDITAQARARTALRAHAAELEARNAELNAFAHTVAHDLKTPLATLSGYSDLLVDNWDSLDRGDRLRALRGVLDGASRMDRTIHEILALASVRRTVDVPLGVVDMADVIREVRDDLSGMIAERGAVITLPDDWPRATGYRPWVREVWLNYISNAVKYGGRPAEQIPPRIVIGWDHAAAGTLRSVRFWVEDNGAGLSPAQQQKLFVEFTRLEHDRVEGHGLGLSIVQRIMARLGGDVGVESTPDRGSRFWFTLPADSI